MERFAMKNLAAWKDSPDRKPLLVQGARQVGKTWLIREFGRACFDEVAYVSFMTDEAMINVFEGDLRPDRLLRAISLQTRTNADSANTLIIFDEVQECPRALVSLKMFAEERPDLFIIAAGSLLGVALHRGISFPVGKVDHLMLYPLCFDEFLLACGETTMAAVLREGDPSLIDAFATRYTDRLKEYYLVGGMPTAILSFLEDGSFEKTRQAQERLIYDYEHDFAKYAAPYMAERIRLVWASAPGQLARENKKFLYSAVRKGARARDYEEAIQWLVDAGLLLRVRRIKKPGLPLAAYEEPGIFKLYLFDVGLLGAAARLDPSVVVEESRLFTEFKGAMAENFVCQEFVASRKIRPYYWSAENSSGEVDFVYEHKGRIVPVEVKAKTNLKAKSLRSFVERNGLEKGLRLSLAGFQDQSWVVNMPLFATGLLPDWLAEREEHGMTH